MSESNDKTTQLIVRVLGGDANRVPSFLGTGFLVSPRWVLTCRHLVVDNYEEKDWSKHRKRERLQIKTNTETIVLDAKKQVFLHPERDLALIKLHAPLATESPLFVRHITFDLHPGINSHGFFVRGYTGEDNASEIRTCATKVLMPQFIEEKHRTSLEELQFRGGPPEGLSGSPVFADKARSIYAGTIYLGGKKSASSRIVTADPVLDFLSKYGVIDIPTCEAKLVFRTSVVFFLRLAGIIIFLAASGVAFYSYGRSPRSEDMMPQPAAPGLQTVSSMPTAGQLPKPVPAPVASIDNCEPEKLFTDNSTLKILVLSFSTDNAEPKDKKHGQSYARRLKLQLESYQDEEAKTPIWKEAELPPVQVEMRNCPRDSHKDARAIGHIKGADVVIWGQFTPSSSTDRNTRTYEAIFTPYITSVNLQSLQTDAPRGIGLQDVSNIQQMTFPQLTSDRPLGLLHLIFALHCLRYDRVKLARHYVEKITPDLLETSSPGLTSLLWSSVAGMYVACDQLELGVEKFREALKRCSPNDLTCKALRTHDLSWALQRVNYTESLKLARDALQLAENSGDRDARILATQIAMLGDLIEPSDALLRQMQELLSGALQDNNWTSALAAMQTIAKVFERLNRLDEAIQMYKDINSWFEEKRMPNLQSAMMYQIGFTLTVHGQHKNSIYYLSRSIELADGEYQIAMSKLARGLAHAHLQETTQALEDLQAALVYWEKIHNYTNEALARSNISDILSIQRLYGPALAQLEEMQQRFQKVEIEAVKAQYYQSFGRVHYLLGHRQRAFNYLNKAIDIYEREQESAYMARPFGKACRDSAYVANELGQLDEAIRRFRRGAALYMKGLDRLHAKECLERAVEVALKNNRSTDAQQVLAEASRFGLGDLRLQSK